jgi:hypothetical protein
MEGSPERALKNGRTPRTGAVGRRFRDVEYGRPPEADLRLEADR